MSQLNVGVLGGRGGQELKGLVAQGKLQKSSGASQTRRGMLSRAARVKVWEERIDEEQEDEEEELAGEEEKERLRVQEKVISKGNPRSGMAQMRASQYVARGGSKAKIINEEIGVFDAERYFGGAEQPAAGWAREEEDELMEGEAGGDLPLSPLVEFGKGQWRLRDGITSAVHGQADHAVRRGAVPWTAAAAGTPGSSFGRRRVESSEFTSPRTSTGSSLSEVEPPLQRTTTAAQLLSSASAHGAHAAGGKSNKSKVQPASPSGRLANFLAKFKAPTPRKSPVSSPIQHLKPATTCNTPPPIPRRSAPSVLSPAKKLFPQYSLGLLPPQAKTSSSPRGRFLRAFSSSSADNTTSSAASHRYHSNSTFHATTPPSMAASSPVSPAARSVPDPYSPIAHSAATTPTSSKLTSVHSNSHLYGSKHTSSSRSKPDSAAPSRCNSSGSFKHQLPFLSRKLKVYLMPDKVSPGKHETAASKSAAQGLDFVRHASRHTDGSKQRRRWLHAEDQVVDEDIELAERLLRVVQDHQSTGHSKSSSISQAMNGGAQFNCKSSNNMRSYVDRVSEYSTRKYDQMHPTSSTIATANLVQISSHGGAPGVHSNGASRAAAHQYLASNPSVAQLSAGKDAEASLYDSDSSSDLFEIETLASVGMGLYRRDLPVYEAKEPFPSPSFSFASSR